MTRYIVKKSVLKGEIAVPPSKSHTLRSILFGALADGTTVIHNYLPAPDTLAMIEACRMFGAVIEVSAESICIQGVKGKILLAKDVIHAGNSGIILRFCTAIGGLASHPIVVTGDESIRYHRPMQTLLSGLSQLGCRVRSMRGDGFAPVIIEGPIKSGKIKIDGEDSQPVSALLIASAFATGPIEINVQNPGEKPWVALTLDWFDRLGIPYENQGFTYYKIPGNCKYGGFEYSVPGDLSSAAFPAAAALVTQSELIVKNIDMNDSQGDKELLLVFKKMGAIIEIDEENKSLHVKKGGLLQGVKLDINSFIDALPILSVIACFAEGETHIYNATVAKQKECNRIACIATELRKMGADIDETEDGLIIRKSFLKGANVLSYNDHRIAMSLAVAGLGAIGETGIDPVESISKTFPTFLQDFHLLGANIEANTEVSS